MKLLRISSVLFCAASVAAGALLFWTSQNVQQAEDRLAALSGAVRSEEQSIRVLSAEWDYLNRPGRLEALAAEHLSLTPSSSSAYNVSDEVSALPDAFVPAMPLRKPDSGARPVALQAERGQR